MTMLSERLRMPHVASDTLVPLLEWYDFIDVVFDGADSPDDGECLQHDGCRSIL
jgi:hypothetical protein